MVTNKENYIISRKTKAIMTVTSSIYRSKILEVDSEYYSLENPEKIIARNCLLNQSSMEGRKLAVQRVLKTNSKIPIPVIPTKGVYLIPTNSPRSQNCVWISFYHINSYDSYKDFVIIKFHDGNELLIKTSKHVFDMQYKKASQVIATFHRSKIFGYYPFLSQEVF